MIALPIAAVVEGRWRLGMADPSPWTLGVVAAFLSASVACAIRGRRGPGRRAWCTCAAICLGLAADKVLDLQNGLSQVGREALAFPGLSPDRRPVQVTLLAMIATSAVVASGLAARRYRGAASAIIACVCMAGFYIGRCLSLHHVDAVLSIHLSHGPTVNTAIEMAAALALIASSVADVSRSHSRS
jgi:hypothetical protein